MCQNPKIAVVIATFNPSKLLERTLNSLSECVIPENLDRVLVAENGPVSMGEGLVTRFQEKLPIEHRFYPNARKCGALNRALAELDDHFVVYFDDDVRIHPNTLVAYARAVEGKSGGAFYGGCCRVDRDEEPEDWLEPFLPAAAKGWAPNDRFCELKSSGALGFNWAAFTNDVRKAGGYDERCGPGTAANSDEINVQRKMLKNGIKFFYIPDAVVWHYVPRERCNPEWLLEYKKKDGIGQGISLAEENLFTRWKQYIGCRAKFVAYRSILFFSGKFLGIGFHYRCRYKIHRLSGKIEGMKLGKNEKSSKRTSSATVAI